MFVDSDTATLAVVESIDGSVAKILSQKRYGTDAVATLDEMIPSLRAEDPAPRACSSSAPEWTSPPSRHT